MFQHRMLQHPRFLALSGRACKALLYLASQYRGDNNGNLQIAPKLARKAGLKAGGNLHRAVKEAAKAGFVLQTRQGGRNRCSLYALTWFPIDECGGRHDLVATHVSARPKCFEAGCLYGESPSLVCDRYGAASKAHH
jgi:hypothetical protein